MKEYKGKQKTAESMCAGYKRGGKVKMKAKAVMPGDMEDAKMIAKESMKIEGTPSKKRMDKKPRMASGGVVDAGAGGAKGRLEKAGMKTSVPVNKAMKKGGKC